jgi:hypothetical protein
MVTESNYIDLLDIYQYYRMPHLYVVNSVNDLAASQLVIENVGGEIAIRQITDKSGIHAVRLILIADEKP